jgi:hypothetical protein
MVTLSYQTSGMESHSPSLAITEFSTTTSSITQTKRIFLNPSITFGMMAIPLAGTTGATTSTLTYTVAFIKM